MVFTTVCSLLLLLGAYLIYLGDAKLHESPKSSDTLRVVSKILFFSFTALGSFGLMIMGIKAIWLLIKFIWGE